MDTYFYKCPVCGYIYMLPAYFENAEPENEMALAHLDMKQGRTCTCKKLHLLMDKKK